MKEEQKKVNVDIHVRHLKRSESDCGATARHEYEVTLTIPTDERNADVDIRGGLSDIEERGRTSRLKTVNTSQYEATLKYIYKGSNLGCTSVFALKCLFDSISYRFGMDNQEGYELCTGNVTVD